MSSKEKAEVAKSEKKSGTTESEKIEAVAEVLEDASLDQLNSLDLDGAVEADDAVAVPENSAVETEQPSAVPDAEITASKADLLKADSDEDSKNQVALESTHSEEEAVVKAQSVTEPEQKLEVAQANSPKQLEAVSTDEQGKNVSTSEKISGNKNNNIVAEVKPKMLDSSFNPNLNGNDDLEQDSQASRDKEIETLRGIIYGSQQREAERRFKTFDARLEAIYEEFRTSASRQQDSHATLENNYNSLEERTKQDFEALEGSLAELPP